jgi:serine phosphatase RsbU (regulator of sigma subunit)
MAEETILVVDDEIANLQKLRRTFINRYPLLSASSAGEALEMVRKDDSIAVIVADQRMPGMTGIEFLRSTLDILPNAVRIILTGFTDIEVLMEAINSCKIFRYIVKPWDPPDLLMSVERGLEVHRLAIENERIRKELIRRERMARELEIASEIQRYILPRQCPVLENYEMGVEYHPAREVGGDLYDFARDSETLHIVIGDVSGKSIPAALYGAVFSGQLQALFSQDLCPSETLRLLNSNLVARYPADNYIAVACCRVDLTNDSVALANSGIPFPLLVRNSRITRLEIPGVPLGLMEGSCYEALNLQLEPGDTLILASDGVTDALNAQGEFYDVRRFTDSVLRHCGKSACEYSKSIYSDIREFIGSADLSDDVTIIALQRRR